MEVLPPDISQGSHISVWELESDFCFQTFRKLRDGGDKTA